MKNFWISQDYQLKAARNQGFTIIRSKISTAVFAIQENEETGRVSLKGWKGKAAKPSFFYGFRSFAKAEEYANQFAKNLAEAEAAKAARKAKAKTVKASDFWSVGDVGVYSWGYDQTNIDYFEVVEVLPKSIRIRPIAEASKEEGYLQGRSQPKRGHFTGDAFLKRLDENGRVYMDHGGLNKWDGKASHWTAYH